MKRDNVQFCIDAFVLSTPLVAGLAFYSAVTLVGIGVKSLRTIVWGKK